MLSVWCLLGLNPLHYVPVFSDDVTYNHQIRSFAEVGFASGYFTINELPNELGFRYGPHGPLYPMLYGSLLALLGPAANVPVAVPALHLALVSTCLFVLLATWRATLAQTLAVAGVAASFWPLVVMLQLSMQEATHYAVAMLVAAALASRKRGAVVLRFGVIATGAALRPLWGLAFLALRNSPSSLLAFGVLALISVFSVPLFLLLLTLVAAPSPNGLLAASTSTGGIGGAAAALAGAVEGLLANGAASIAWATTPSAQAALETHAVVAVATLLVWGALIWRFADWPARSVWLVLVIAVSVQMLTYGFGSYRLFRILSPIAFLVLLVFLRNRGGMVLASLVVVSGLASTTEFRWFLSAYRAPMFAPPSQAYLDLQAALPLHLAYAESGPAWCNTVLVDNGGLGPFVAAFPPGMGVSVVHGQNARRVLGEARSRYVLLTGAVETEAAGMNLLVVSPELGLRLFERELENCN